MNTQKDQPTNVSTTLDDAIDDIQKVKVTDVVTMSHQIAGLKGAITVRNKAIEQLKAEIAAIESKVLDLRDKILEYNSRSWIWRTFHRVNL